MIGAEAVGMALAKAAAARLGSAGAGYVLGKVSAVPERKADPFAVVDGEVDKRLDALFHEQSRASREQVVRLGRLLNSADFHVLVRNAATGNEDLTAVAQAEILK